MLATVQFLFPVLCLAVLCAGWVALQRWIERSEPSLGKPRPCGGCCGDKLCEIENNDPWFADCPAPSPTQKNGHIRVVERKGESFDLRE